MKQTQTRFAFFFKKKKTCFHHSAHKTLKNNRNWSAENPMLIHKAPLHYVTVGVWCAMSATRILDPLRFPTP